MNGMSKTSLKTKKHINGEAGYRSLYPSHAKRILYHLSYIPMRNSVFSYCNNGNSVRDSKNYIHE